MKRLSHKEKVRRAFWEFTIGSWVIAAIVVVGGTITAAVTTRDFELTLVLFLVGVASAAVFGPLAGLKMADSAVLIREMRDRYEAELDAALDPPVSDDDAPKDPSR